MVLVKKLKFFHLSFSSKLGLENASWDILARKNPFLDYKNKKVNKSINWDFSNELVHNFGHKL